MNLQTASSFEAKSDMSRTPTSLLLSVSRSRLSSSVQNLHEIADDILHILIREASMQRKRHLILKQMEGILILIPHAHLPVEHRSA